MTTETKASLPIGVFDSGVGGLSVLKQLITAMPNESFIYLGDTARVPYGTKSADTVVNYSVQICETLVKRGIKMLIVACNTATCLALDELQKHFPDIPVIGVLEPGVKLAVAKTSNEHIAVIATEATISSKGYQSNIDKALPGAKITTQVCGLFVALVEEGFHQDEVAQLVAKHYLQEMFLTANAPDTLILGCTHFPLLNQVIQSVIPQTVTVIDSAKAISQVVKSFLVENNCVNPQSADQVKIKILVTDSPKRFAMIADRFIAMPLEVELIDII
ncbi:MAG: glutamate racemase [Pseudomonadota bacterium]